MAMIGITLNSCNDSENLQERTNQTTIETPSQTINGQYIVTFKEGTLRSPNLSRSASSQNLRAAYNNSMISLKSEINSKLSSLHIEENKIKTTFGYALQGFVAELTEEQVEQLQNDPRVKRIEKDYIISLDLNNKNDDDDDDDDGDGDNDGGGNDGGGGTNQETPWGITRVGGAVSGAGKTAWIIDTGIELNHPDLNVNANKSFSFVPTEPSPNDQHGHGTHVGGTVGALNNNIGVVGVAPGANLVALKVLNRNGSGQFSWTVQALDYVAANAKAGDAVNMSLGPRLRFVDSSIDDATLRVAQKGINIAIAAGNSNDDCSFYSPARVNHPNVYTVSNMTSSNTLAWSSNYGAPVDYAAPGTGVKSTWINGGYATHTGTSMASPHVCGLLISGGVRGNGVISSDKDNTPDPIAHRK